MIACHFQDWVTKRLWLQFCLLSLNLYLVNSKGNQVPCCELPYGQAHATRN